MLTDAGIRNVKPSPKARKLFDERGLYLLITPAGGKLWRLKYRIHGREKLLSFGAYPDVSLADARDRRDEARKLVASGFDPSLKRKAQRHAADDSFEAVFREWYRLLSANWSEAHASRVLSRVERNLLPYLGSRPINEIRAPELLAALKRVEARGAIETSHKLRQFASMIFRFAVSCGRAERDPSADLRGALAPVKPEHFAAVTEPKKVGPLLRALDSYDGSLIVRCALRLAPLLFVRPGELRQMEWKEIDFTQSQWAIPARKKKEQLPLIVPLSTQAVAILRELQPVTGDGLYVFPSGRTAARPMSDNAILAALRRLEIPKEEMTCHGFRALARTILDEVLGVRVDWIEHQLGHSVKDPNGRAYNRTSFLPERTKMMQDWANYLDGLKAAGVNAAAAKQA